MTKTGKACYDTGRVYSCIGRSRGAVHFPLTFDRRGVRSSQILPIGGDPVVTYEGLFAFCLVIIAVISLTIQVYGNRK